MNYINKNIIGRGIMSLLTDYTFQTTIKNLLNVEEYVNNMCITDLIKRKF